MPTKKTLTSLITLLAATCALLTAATPARAASKEKVLYSFNGNDAGGEVPQAGLIFDDAGNLYGTTYEGGTYDYGTLFELTPGANGTWAETVLYSFCSATGCTDGANPDASLIFDGAGNLYGTTYVGGTGTGCGGNLGCGTIFELTPGAGGTRAETVLYSFCSISGCTDGALPPSSLIFDAAGNLYGTTAAGGAYGYGTVFELMPGANGTWTETVLHSFRYDGEEGYQPQAGLIFDAPGNLYGTACDCGAYGYGTVFELMPTANGTWTEKVLHRFNANGKDGTYPQGSLIFDAAGNLYGTTSQGGGKGCRSDGVGCGTVFELMAGTNGKWAEKVLHRFIDNGKGGAHPYASLVFDAAGNLYSTTYNGGSTGGGTVFRLAPSADGRWTEEVLLDFFRRHGPNGGYWPSAGLIIDAAGNLYGTAEYGGRSGGSGTVFEITPNTRHRGTSAPFTLFVKVSQPDF